MYFKVTYGVWKHPKFDGLPAAALALWVRAGSWSVDLETDGYVPADRLYQFRARQRDAAALVAARLWEPEGDGWRFHGWLEYQPSAAAAAEVRAKDRARKAAAAAVAEAVGIPARPAHAPLPPRSPASENPETPGESAEVPDGFPPPLPPPLPPKEKNSSFLKGDPLPDDWSPNEAHRELAMTRRIHLVRAASEFRQHAHENQRRARNWDAAFTAWLRGANLQKRPDLLDIDPGDEWRYRG